VNSPSDRRKITSSVRALREKEREMKRKLLIFNHRGTCRDLQQFIKIRNRIAFSLREALEELEEMEGSMIVWP